MRGAGLVMALSVAFGAVVAGCPTLPTPVPCDTIPEGGCPSGRGGTCDDPVCEALYDCIAGQWTRTEVCEARDAGAGGGDGDGGLPEAGPCTPVSIDTSGKATLCTPDLQEPDCPVEAAMGCAETVCVTGCSDFFLCKKSGWVDVAYCTDEGELVITQ
jgi:hypothetical protein